MKFATLALVGLAAAKHEETELVGKRWRWRHIPALMEQEGRIVHTMEDIWEDVEDKLDDAHVEEKLRALYKRYGPAAMKWFMSEPVQKVHAVEQKIWNSGMGQRLQDSAMHVVEDAMKMHWEAGFDQDGYAEWVKNEDVAHLFEDVYEVKEALKRIAESPLLGCRKTSDDQSYLTCMHRR